jgi:hypothetical protein
MSALGLVLAGLILRPGERIPAADSSRRVWLRPPAPEMSNAGLRRSPVAADPFAPAWSTIMAAPDTVGRSAALAELMARWAREAPSALLPALLRQNRAGSLASLVAAISALTAEDPVAARAWLGAAFPERIPPRLLEAHYEAWPPSAAQSLRERVAALENGEEKDFAILCAVAMGARNEPLATWNWYVGLLAGGAVVNAACMEELARRTWLPLAENQPADALALFRAAPTDAIPPVVRELAVRTALRTYVERGGSAADALAWANASIPDFGEWERAALEVLGMGLRVTPGRTTAVLQAIGDREWNLALGR